jgi:hypothetical protein
MGSDAVKGAVWLVVASLTVTRVLGKPPHTVP